MNVIHFLRTRGKRRETLAYSEREIVGDIRRSCTILLLLLFAHGAAMVHFEGMGPGDALWLTFTTITTVGYGDLYASSAAGRAATVLLLYLVGITMLAKLGSDYIDYRITRRERMRKGQWSWKMKDHILFINAPKNNAEQYFVRMVLQMRDHPDLATTPIAILSHAFSDGLPHSLTELDVVHYAGASDAHYSLEQVCAADAAHIVVLSEDEYDANSDSLTFAIVHRLADLGLQSRTIAECVQDENRARIRGLGVRTLLRPIRSYPEIVIRSITAPGTEVVLENLFTYHGDHPRRYEIHLSRLTWAEIVIRLARIDAGTPMAYVNLDGNIVCHPHANEAVHATALILIVREESIPDREELVSALT